MKAPFIDIALSIVRIRTARGLSQRELARRLGTSHPTIVRWERPGYRGYTLAKLTELAEALDHRVDVRFIPKRFTNTSTEEAQDTGWNELDLIRNKAGWRAQPAAEWYAHQ